MPALLLSQVYRKQLSILVIGISGYVGHSCNQIMYTDSMVMTSGVYLDGCAACMLPYFFGYVKLPPKIGLQCIWITV